MATKNKSTTTLETYTIILFHTPLQGTETALRSSITRLLVSLLMI